MKSSEAEKTAPLAYLRSFSYSAGLKNDQNSQKIYGNAIIMPATRDMLMWVVNCPDILMLISWMGFWFIHREGTLTISDNWHSSLFVMKAGLFGSQDDMVKNDIFEHECDYRPGDYGNKNPDKMPSELLKVLQKGHFAFFGTLLLLLSGHLSPVIFLTGVKMLILTVQNNSLSAARISGIFFASK